MKRFLTIALVVLFSVIGVAQADDGSGPDKTNELSMESVSAFDRQIESIVALVEPFPENERPQIAKTIALAVGLYAQETESGCVLIAEEDIFTDTSALSVGPPPGSIPCEIYMCDHYGNPTLCYTHCDDGNFVQFCTGGTSSCCGCTWNGFGCGFCAYM